MRSLWKYLNIIHPMAKEFSWVAIGISMKYSIRGIPKGTGKVQLDSKSSDFILQPAIDCNCTYIEASSI